MRLEGSSGLLILVRCEVVTYDACARLQLGHKYIVNVCGKSFAILRVLDNPAGDQLVMGQACDKGLGAPYTKGSVHFQT